MKPTKPVQERLRDALKEWSSKRIEASKSAPYADGREEAGALAEEIASLAEELLDSPPVDQGPAEANSYHQRLGAKWMCEAITREAETTFRLNRNFQAFAKDIGCKWQDDAYWRKPAPQQPGDASLVESLEVKLAHAGVQRLRLSSYGEALLRGLTNKAKKLGFKPPPWSDQDIITLCETLPPEMQARLQKEFGLILTPQNPPVAGPPKRKVLTCNRICAAVFHLTGGAHRTDCQANEPECPTCHAPRWEVHPSATPGGPATKCPDPYHEVETEEQWDDRLAKQAARGSP